MKKTPYLLTYTLAAALALTCSSRSALAQDVATGPLVNPTSVVLPKDEAPHAGYDEDWWYFVGHLTGVDATGKIHNYGFQLSTVRSNVASLEPASAEYSTSVSFTDLTRKTFDSDFDFFVQQPDVFPKGGGFNISVDNQVLSGVNGRYSLSDALPDGNYAAKLSFIQATPPALHGVKGIIPYGPYGVSAYYSYTNLFATGTVIDHGVTVYVTGIAWYDHQFGDFLAGPGYWNWFSLQLTNGTQYMMYFLHDASGNLVQTVGTQVSPTGATTNLAPGSFNETPLGSWTSPTTGNTYQENWTITVPKGTLTVTVTQPNQELTLGGGGYLEADLSVTGIVNGLLVGGAGYYEQTPPDSPLCCH